jgi:hypothetical protein
MLRDMKDQKSAPNPDDIELHPDAWERFVDAVKRIARHPPIQQADIQAKPPPKRQSPAGKRKR